MLKQIEVCFTPAIYPIHHNPESVVVIVDILRATSAISTAFMNGVRHIIPVGTVEEARGHKENGHFVAAERDGLVLDFADFGNSPYNFTPDRVKDNDIVYSTTNGTNAIHLAEGCKEVIIGSYLNLGALVKHLCNHNKDAVILCAGWKNRFSLEDSLFAGALSYELIKTGQFDTICDSANAAMDLWSIAKDDLHNYILKAAQKQRLAKNGLDDVIEFCHTLNQTNIVPVLNGDKLIGIPVE